MPDIELSEVVARLAADPMYQLSTAGQELFHTNMLYWLARQRPAESRPLWDLLGVDAPVGEGPDGVGLIAREWRHIDLVVDSGKPGRKLILENKVLAIATREQLEGYHAAISRDPRFAHWTTSWRLLTLLVPTFRPPAPWQLVTYAELLPALDATAEHLSGDDLALVRGYNRLVRTLVDLTQAADPARRPDDPVFLEAGPVEALQEARALSLVRKLQMSRCAELLEHRLEDHLPAELIRVGAGLTNTQGLIQLYLPGPDGRQLGWQLQGTQLRFVVITSKRDPKQRAAREATVQAQHSDYFEGGRPPGELASLLSPYAGKKQWLGYEPDFVYRYETLSPTTTWTQLLDLLVWASVRAFDFARQGQHES